MLKVTELQAFYGDSHILHGVSLEVPSGGRVALVGRNGAGKSTVLKSIMGAGPRVKGRVEFEGQDLSAVATFRRARRGLCLVPEDRRIFAHMTVLENIAFAMRAASVRDGVPEQVLAGFAMLTPLSGRLGGQLSGGQQQMLALARAVAGRPLVLLLDEPTEGLAPVIVEQMAAQLAGFAGAGGPALLLCEQNLWFARRCTDHVYIIDSGAIVFSGDWASFDRHADIVQRYLAV